MPTSTDGSDRSTIDAITDALHRYTRAIDTKDWALLRDSFTADCVAQYRTKVLNGVDAIVAYMQPSHDPIDGSLHRLTNIEISVDPSGTTASATSYIDALLVHRLHPDGPTFRAIGTYRDSLRLADRWRLAHRTYQQLWVEGSRTILGETHR